MELYNNKGAKMAQSGEQMVRAAQHSEKGFEGSVLKMDLEVIQQIIDKADSLYYRQGLTPIMSDDEYDFAKKRLREMTPEDERLTRVGVPYTAEELRDKTKHTIPMGSLDNTKDGITGYDEWAQTIKKKLKCDEFAVCISLKLDGASIRARYKDGKLVEVVTRGNGEVGENITANAVNFRNLPTVLPRKIDLDVRGEAILSRRYFQQICERDGIEGSKISNPRNVGNGILGRDNGQDSDLMRFTAFDVAFYDNEHKDLEFTTEAEKLDALRTLGFKSVPHSICATPQEVENFYFATIRSRDELPIEIDGVVVVLNEIEQQQKFVTADPKTRLRPKYARAIKFDMPIADTVVEDVLLTVGHTGAIIPTAKLKEARVGGVNVTHALLNNWDEIKRLDIAIGDTVTVGLAGDIIPKVLRCVKKGKDRKEITEPSRCPSCGEPTTRNLRGKAGAVTFCSSGECPAAALAKVSHWVGTSKKGVGIMGIGDTILKALWDSRLISDAADLYELNVLDLKDVELDGGVRVGTSRAMDIKSNINKKRKLPLHIFLGSLGIDLLGRRRVQILAKAAGGQLDRLEDWMDDEKLATLQVPGLGDTIRSSIRAGLDEVRPLVQKLLGVGVEIDYPDKPVEADNGQDALPFAGLSFCLTGTRAFSDDIERMGGTLKSGVSKSLTFLVQKDPLSQSSKTLKAEKYGVRIISIDTLKQAVNGEISLQSVDE
jgi:DNA ligase (NAD+)